MSKTHFEVAIDGVVHRVDRAEVTRLARAVADGPAQDLAGNIEGSLPDGSLVGAAPAQAFVADEVVPPLDKAESQAS